MNIKEVPVYTKRIGEKNGGNGQSFLNIGKRGQIIEGVISQIADYITIDFKEASVNVAKNAIRNPKEGDIRKFQILDISKDNLVLKEVGNDSETEAVRVQARTTAAPNSYSFEEQLKNAKSAADAKVQANEELAILNGEDCQSIEEDGNSLIENTKAYIERAVERNKAQKEWNIEQQQKGLQFREEMRESREKAEDMGFLRFKSGGALKTVLEAAGIPATPENEAMVSDTVKAGLSALEMTDQTKYYIVHNDLAPTIANLYHGKYTAITESGGITSEQEFENYKGQIMEILESIGMDTEEGLKNARWLFERELPVNEITIGKLSELNQMKEEMTPEKVLYQILFTMAGGAHPKDTVLNDQAFVAAREAVKGFQEVSDASVIKVADYLLKHPEKQLIVLNEGENAVPLEEPENQGFAETMHVPVVNLELYRRAAEGQLDDSSAFKSPAAQTEKESYSIPLVLLDGMSQQELMQVRLKRQLEEVRQKMTMQAAVSMEKRGIHIETEAIENVIEELRKSENHYTADQIGEFGGRVAEEHFNLLQETLGKTRDISNGFAGVLGTGVRFHKLLTMNELHAAVRSQNVQRQKFFDTYETVATTVRADLGDSIQKAFASIPEILEDLGLEDTEANERAVRILGYNSLEITEENIETVKFFDAKVNHIIDLMKPTTVLELIRDGENPLDIPLDELNAKLTRINEDKAITEEERYTRFLWQMERDGQISEQERSGYIGVYRLLRQIQKSDGAPIGALLESGQEVTLGNLLTQIRIRKGPGIDAKIDDDSEVREMIHTRESITDQIQKGFGPGDTGTGERNHSSKEENAFKEENSFIAEKSSMEENSSNEDLSSYEQEKKDYYNQLVKEVVDEVSPSKILEITDGDMQILLDTSLEQFAWQLKQASGNENIKKEYYEQLAGEIREGLSDTEKAAELLEKLAIPDTIGNLLAADELLSGGTNVYKEIYDRRKLLSKNRERELEQVIDHMEESVGEEESLERSCEQAEKIMQEVLTKSTETADIRFEELQNLRKLGRGLNLQVAFRKSKSYDIPIRTGDTITSLNLTIVRGADETGKVQISMEDEIFGSFSLDFKVVGTTVKGLVLCSTRQGFEAFQSQGEILEANMESAGFSVKNISYGMDFKTRNELLNGVAAGTETDTRRLYQLSKVLVRQVVNIIRN